MTGAGPGPALPPSSAVDHLVYAAPSLSEGVERIRSLLGADPSPGGRHPRWGTRNALVGLGPATYLEIIGPDDEARAPAEATSRIRRPFAIDTRSGPGLAGWAARVSPLEEGIGPARRAGFALGSVMAGSRETPDGTLLRWRLTDPAADREGGTLPFLIDWETSRHPATSLRHSLSLRRIRIRHPDPPALRSFLRSLAPRVVVERGPHPGISATLRTPNGTVSLT